MASAALLGWLTLGPYLVGPLFFFLDPLAVVAFGLVALAVAWRDRPRWGVGVSLRGMAALVAFAAVLIFFSTRDMGGFGDDSRLRVYVTVLDEGTGRPVPGARVAALDGRSRLAETITDEAGRGLLEYDCLVKTDYSRLYSKRTIRPGTVVLEVLDKDSAARRRPLRCPAEYRFSLVDEPFGRPDRFMAIETSVELSR